MQHKAAQLERARTVAMLGWREMESLAQETLQRREFVQDADEWRSGVLRGERFGWLR